MGRDFLDLYEQENSSGDSGGADTGVTAVKNAGLGTNKETLSKIRGRKNKKSKVVERYPPRGNKTELDSMFNIDPRY